jgi:hypothetical protein
MSGPLPKWLKLALHVTILTVTGLAALTQLPVVFNGLHLPEEAHVAGLLVTYAGLVVTYILHSPLVIGWLSLHDPDDVIAAESERKLLELDKRSPTLRPPPMPPTKGPPS